MKKNNEQFLTFFPDHVYRYLDTTGNKRDPQSLAVRSDELNLQGYDSYFTVNGFKDAPRATKEHCSSINAFFVDIDGRKEEAELEEIKKKLDPTFIIETKRGYHIYWVLDEPIYRNEITPEEWSTNVTRWEKIEQSIVDTLEGDNNAKDLPRILRVPDTYYWKASENAYKSGIEGVFKIKGIYKNVSATYSMNQVEEVFPVISKPTIFADTPMGEKTKKFADAERKDFFDRVNNVFPIQERESFIRLTTAHPESLPFPNCRNQALLITATLMKQAGWTQEKAINQIKKVGWHGMEMERGGWNEITSTINSAYSKGYTYSFKNEIISYNMSKDEQVKIQDAFVLVAKARKELDKARFADYEKELLLRFPFLKKNDIGMLFNYESGVYKPVLDLDLQGMILRSLDDDMLWNYRTNKNVSDKISCLLAIVPKLVITNDFGYIANVKNGLLNIYTGELKPHTPDFVSLIQYPVVYDPNAKCPTWDSCVSDWMEGPEKEDKITLLKQFCGYILSSSMFYDRALFMVGDGGNGKSTFIDTISLVIGPEATSHIDLESLYGAFGMHGLIGKRLNIIEEVHGNFYQSNKLKKLISGEQVTIDIKYKPQFTFRPQAKFVFSVNQLPRVDDTSTATERRICAVHFRNNYRKNPNVRLRSSFGLLAQELSGILNWMIAGAVDLNDKQAFIMTQEQTNMLNEYREENSSVEGFLKECVIPDETESIETPTLYIEYKRWCQSDGGRKTKAKITFTKEVKAFGAKDTRFSFAPREGGNDEAKFVGIKLNPLWVNQNKDKTDWGGY
jgi:P4 family phage/plasmid primase-like protien